MLRTERTSDGYKHFLQCDLCRREFQFGPGRYAGRKVVSWNILVCERCEAANHDGLVPQSHPDLMKRLADRGVEVRLNSRGWLSIPRD
jgi:hypothetical protein